MRLADIAATSRAVGQTSSRLEKVALLAECLRRLAPAEVAMASAWLAGELPQGRLGVGWAVLKQALGSAAPAAEASLEIADVDGALSRLAAAQGPGSAAERRRGLADLLSRATPAEQEFLSRLLVGELRQGALEGVLLEAVARAASVPVAEVRRAVMAAGGLPPVAAAALSEGPAGLSRFRLRLLEPLRPMLAETASSPAEALELLGQAAFEWKLDGARVQVHKSGEAVRLFTRSLQDVTAAAPEVAEVVQALPASSLILDGEVLALEAGGRPRPFQETMRRLGRRLEVERLRTEIPLSVFFFDVLHADGEDLLDRPASERSAALARLVPPALLVPRLVTADPAAADAFLAEALARGHEGVMAKSLSAPYQAGSRGRAWLKVKPAHTLDLVVLAAEWGHGRRRGRLSNLHLGARDQAGGFAMLGKTFKGLTDEMLAWQTERLRALAVSEDGIVVRVRPELVVEVAFDGLQTSPRYPSGLALRFARVKRFRPDKRPEEADTLESVRAIHRREAAPPRRG
ncbi:MAG TPA: ATP-dependent DNA ligase [Anaeromyxobacteraceae bacterium]|nr:ATP-dependent DNA ligase [Anaeromyxobacteraceae bacterium]